ncbi:MAG: thiosulfate oxidation carrier complex protein SoxZ [Deltaproteobacteria bacterium]|nr:thiosulfate oxidation carrier complex protein SoxZ [Deltaproteobacteria bacterium]
MVLATLSFGWAQEADFVEGSARRLAALLEGTQTTADPDHTPRLTVPRVVEVASEVPVTVSVPLAGDGKHYIRRLILFDENSVVQVKYVATFSPRVRQPQVGTLIKMAKNSRLKAIAECSVHGRFLGVSEEIQVGVGGCGAGQEPSRELVGEVLRVRVRDEGEVLQGNLLFRHPMMSGYVVNAEGDVTKSYEPFFLESARVSYQGEGIVDLELGPGLSENPNVSFLLPRLGSEPLKAEAVNSAGQRFSLAVRLPE